MTAATPKVGIAAALLEVQKNAPALHKDATNPHYRNRYVTLDAVLEAVRPLLNSNSLVLTQAPSYSEEGAPVLTTTITHVPSGEKFTSSMFLFAPKQDPQGQGSAITYARRYALLSILGLTADEDDDGNKGSGGGKPRDLTESHADHAARLAEAVAALPGTRELVGAEVLAQIETLRKEIGTSPSALKAYAVNTHSVDSLEDLSLDEARMTYAWLAAKQKKAA